MARRIIILEDLRPGSADGASVYRYALWLDVPLARQTFYANGSATSAVNKGLNAASAAELSAIQSGAILEIVEQIDVRGLTLAQIQSALVSRFNTVQAFVNGAGANSWDHYGTVWDGTVWTLNTVA